MKVISIGIGQSINSAELSTIATDAQHMFTVSSFDILNSIQFDLKNSACGGTYLFLFDQLLFGLLLPIIRFRLRYEEYIFL